MKEFPKELNFTEIGHEVVKKTKTKSKMVDNLIIDQGPMEKVIKIDSLVDFYNKLFKLPVEFSFKKHPDATFDSNRSEDVIYYDLFKKIDRNFGKSKLLIMVEYLKSGALNQLVFFRLLQVRPHHFFNQLAESHFGLPAECFLCPGRITQEGIHLGGAEVIGIY